MAGMTKQAAAMQALTPSPGADRAGWSEIRTLWPELAALSACPQDPVHHAEGDAGTHTGMVLDELVRGGFWQALPTEARFRLFWAAVFHDVGKPATTVHEADGRITSHGHSRAGAGIARSLLREARVPLVLREEICSLVTFHQVPFWLFEREDWQKAAIRISLSCSAEELVAHARADARGRICADMQDMLDRTSLSEAAFDEIGAIGEPFRFANPESRFAYFEKEDRSPWHAAHEDYRCQVTLVCGLPGTGKDTWIGRNMPGVPCVSLDQVRLQLGVSPEDNQGQVIQEGFEQARIHLRARRDFVWNATNVTRSNREKVIRLARDYGARIRVVYLEVAPDVLLDQNGRREAAVPPAAIARLARKLEPPHPSEAHEVVWISDGERVFEAGAEPPPPRPAP